MNELPLRPIEACPLCGSNGARNYSPPLPNLYSEKLSALLEVSESRLLETVGNMQCQSCRLIYKRRWFEPDTLRFLFSHCVPVHPKGWDIVSGRFSADNFRNEVHQYQQALAQQDLAEVARFRRALSSIVDAIPDRRDATRLTRMRDAIETGDTETLLAQHDWLAEHMDESVPYSRFAGFSSPDLFHYLVQRTGPIRSYGEVGCPLWGLLRHASENGAQSVFLHRAEPNYWGPACRSGGYACLDALLEEGGVEVRPWSDHGSEARDDTLDVLGLFQYLDHVEQPDDFIAEAAERARSLAIILDGVDQPPAVQHFTAWPESAVETLADRHGFQVHSDFNAIRESGNYLYLLARREASAAA